MSRPKRPGVEEGFTLHPAGFRAGLRRSSVRDAAEAGALYHLGLIAEQVPEITAAVALGGFKLPYTIRGAESSGPVLHVDQTNGCYHLTATYPGANGETYFVTVRVDPTRGGRKKP